MAGRMINGAAALADLVRPASEADAPGVHRLLPVVPELSGLLPGRGLRRGGTVAVDTSTGATSLLLALLSAASRAGSWCAVVGLPDLGALAAAESGIALDRLALVPSPGPDWPTVVGALIDGVDVVVTAVPGPVAAPIAARLAARARQRGAVLVPFGAWSGADVTLRVTRGDWEGLGHGHGRLRRRRITVLARGRGAAARPRETTMWMPGLTLPPPFPPPPSASADPSEPAAADPRTSTEADRGFGRAGIEASPVASASGDMRAASPTDSPASGDMRAAFVPAGPVAVRGIGSNSASVRFRSGVLEVPGLRAKSRNERHGERTSLVTTTCLLPPASVARRVAWLGPVALRRRRLERAVSDRPAVAPRPFWADFLEPSPPPPPGQARAGRGAMPAGGWVAGTRCSGGFAASAGLGASGGLGGEVRHRRRPA